MRNRSVLASLLVLWVALPASAAFETRVRSGPVTSVVSLTPDAPVIGDPMILSIEVTAEEGVELLMPDFGEALDRFRIVDFVPRSRVDGAGRAIQSQRYTLQAPSSGEHVIPSILIEFVDRRPGQDPAPQGADAHELLTESIAFEVASVLPDAAAADLAPPAGRLEPLARRSGGPWVWIIAALALLAAGAPFALRAWQAQRARADVRSAYELARAELDALMTDAKPSDGHIDAFFVALSGIVRGYVERRFAVRSPELTTERFLELASASPDLTDAHRDLLRDFLRQCDLVKFAHYIPSAKAIDQAVGLAGLFIEDTCDDHSHGGAEAATR
jgi:hypothetical protein